MPPPNDGANQAANPVAPAGMGGIADVISNLSPEDPGGPTDPGAGGGEKEEAPKGASSINDLLSNNEDDAEKEADDQTTDDGTPTDPGHEDPNADDKAAASQTDEENQPGGEGGEGEDDGEQIVETFAQLVEQMEWDPEWADNLKLDLTVDGETRGVTIGELKKTHQTFEAASKRLDDAKAAAREVHATLDEDRKKLAGTVTGIAALNQMAEKLFGLDAVKDEMQAARAEGDQVKYLSLKADLEEKQEAMRQVRDTAGNAMREVLDGLNRGSEMTEEEKNAKAAEEREKLFEAIPEWSGEENHQKALKESTELVEYANQTYGFEPKEVIDNLDHRNLVVLRKAFLYDRQQGAAEAAKKRVLKIPTVTNPGPKTTSSSSNSPSESTPVQILYRK